jgi:ABC-2 type transport system permease protein
MISLLRADLFKTRKRAMGWVMLIIIALFVPLQMLPMALLTPGRVNYAFPGVLLQGLDPVPFVGVLMLIILGAVGIGSEYGYDTWKNLLTRRAGRVPFIISKWLVLIVAIGIGLVVLVPLGLALGLALNASLHLTGPDLPLSLGSVLLMIVLQTLTPLAAGSIAIMGAIIGRSSVAGIIAGIVWFLVDSLLGGVFSPASFTSSIGVLQAQLTGVVQSSNGSIAQVHISGALAGPLGIIPGLLVVAYLVIPIAIAAYVFQKRDMVGVG